jgi:hypothetical protein
MASSLVRRSASCASLLVLCLLLAAAPADAQSISSTSASTAGSTGNNGNSDGSVRSSVATQINDGTTFRTRFAWNLSADVGVASTRDANGSAQHNLAFNVTAPGGYRLDVAQQRQGIIQRNSDISGCDGAADTTGISGGQTGASLFSGSLSIGDPGGIGNGGGSANTPFNQSQSAVLTGNSNGSAVGHTLTFTWNGTTRSNSCEAAVRQGEGSSVSGCDACIYPGDPSRTQNNDGHFVTVTLTNYCGNGVVDDIGAVDEDCDGGACCSSTCQFLTSSTTCRGSAGVCDPAEVCTGTSASCPSNTFSSSATVCRGVAGVCDVAENCTGSTAACPGNGFLNSSNVCRGTAGVCDVAENCTGSSAA